MYNTHGADLDSAQHKIKTSCGISEQYYAHTQDTPIHGPGQGSGAAPAAWTIVSSLLLDLDLANSHGLTFSNPNQSIMYHHSSDAFVDNTTRYINYFQQEVQEQVVSSQTISHLMTQDTTTWKYLLEACGGYLELSKCVYYLLNGNLPP